MTVPETPVNSTDDLARVEWFFAEQLKLPILDPEPTDVGLETGQFSTRWQAKLSLTELAKVRDLCQDVISFAPGAKPGVFARLTLLFSYLFAGFEWTMGADWRLIFKRLFMRDSAPPARPADCHEAPAGASAEPFQCAKDYRLFDRLSQLQGGKFRGAVVFNCVLGVVASGGVLYALATPAHDGEHVPWATIIELICLVLIGLVYYRGYTPGAAEEVAEAASASVMTAHWSAQRWHQRWLEYRLLAERFRYVDLLLPLGADMVLNLAIAQRTKASRMWHERYFEWCVISAAPSRQSVREYRDHALAVIVGQENYHVRNHQRRGRIADRFDDFADFVYLAALAFCIFDIAVAYVPILHAKSTGPSFATILFWAGLLPVVSAATYTIMTHAEYAKAANASGETFKHFHQLHERLSLLPVSEVLADKDSLKEMAPLVIDFAATAITESTGWHAMLRDKNVPH
jgi:hypothetical protein